MSQYSSALQSNSLVESSAVAAAAKDMDDKDRPACSCGGGIDGKQRTLDAAKYRAHPARYRNVSCRPRQWRSGTESMAAVAAELSAALIDATLRSILLMELTLGIDVRSQIPPASNWSRISHANIDGVVCFNSNIFCTTYGVATYIPTSRTWHYERYRQTDGQTTCHSNTARWKNESKGKEREYTQSVTTCYISAICVADAPGPTDMTWVRLSDHIHALTWLTWLNAMATLTNQRALAAPS